MATTAKTVKSLDQTPKYTIRHRNRCRKCGRPRAFYRRFNLCRLCLRDLARKGLIPGLTKASW